MSLETEFRVRLQRLNLGWSRLYPQCVLESKKTFAPISATSHVTANRHTPQNLPEPRPSLWVKLLHPPQTICSDEALLLCKGSGDRWIAWIPDHGKILLKPGDFYWEVGSRSRK